MTQTEAMLIDAIKEVLAFLDRPGCEPHEWRRLMPKHIVKLRMAVMEAERKTESKLSHETITRYAETTEEGL